MKIRIIHFANDNIVTVASYITKKKYVTVALEEAYYLTNNIKFNWYENDDLDIPAGLPNSLRSTSVGDFISVDVGDIREYYRVAGFGFHKMELNELVNGVRFVDLIMDSELREIKSKEDTYASENGVWDYG